MKRIRSFLLLLAATMFTTALHAQHFDWVKSYSGQEPTGKFWNYIVSSVTDSHGNLYVAGQFARGASVDGQDLLPFPPHGGEINNPNACIMKISPDGNVLWMKILHGNYGASSSIHSIQLVGDTSLYAYASVCIPMFDDEYRRSKNFPWIDRSLVTLQHERRRNERAKSPITRRDTGMV